MNTEQSISDVIDITPQTVSFLSPDMQETLVFGKVVRLDYVDNDGALAFQIQIQSDTARINVIVPYGVDWLYSYSQTKALLGEGNVYFTAHNKAVAVAIEQNNLTCYFGSKDKAGKV